MSERTPSLPAQLELRLDSLDVSGFVDGKAIAAHLGFSWPYLRYQIYKRPIASKYFEFRIPKRTGGERTILAPCDEIKEIQRRILSKILYPLAPTKNCAHGFLPKRSILTGASEHVRSRYVLNIDIKDFFPSINFGRVYGMLKGKPYFLPKKAAAVIAHACCYRGALPQGAPTSPILSNMVCGKLDSELVRFCRPHGVVYTRYADDLSFSTRRSTLPEGLVVSKPITPANCELDGTQLKAIVERNGFSINPAKTRLKSRSQRLEVTGLTVNKKINIQRAYLRNLRATIHALSVYGDDAEKHFFANHNPTGSRSLKATIAGKLDFVRQVRGPLDPLYLKLANKAYQIDEEFFGVPDKADLAKFVRDRTWVVEDPEGRETQGSAFMLEGFGLVTCEHVAKGPLIAYRSHRPHERFTTTVVDRDADRDLALLSIEGKFEGFEANLLGKEHLHQPVFVCGFPNYSNGGPNCSPGFITSFRTMFGTRRFVVSQPIIKGASGGPILNARWQVVGVAATGPVAAAGQDIDSTCIAIAEFQRIRPT